MSSRFNPEGRFTTRRRFPLIAAFFACLPFMGAAEAAEPEHALQPAAPPLLVARLSYAPLMEDLRGTRQAEAFGLNDRDYSGEIPGMSVRLESLDAFLRELIDMKAENVWYCLAQQGSSLARQTGAMGWEGEFGRNSDPRRPTLLLKRFGLDEGKRTAAELDPQKRDRARLTLCRDKEARTALLQAPPAESDWRFGLNRFLEREYFGVWINPRPLLGMATLFTGIDFRTALSSMNLNVPTSIQVDAFDTAGDLGLALRAEGVLPKVWDAAREPVHMAAGRPDALATIILAPPEEILLPFLKSERLATALFALNVKATPLIPETITIDIWRGNGETLLWEAHILMRDAVQSREQFLRAWSLVESIGSGPQAALPVTRAQSGTSWTIEYDGGSYRVTLIEAQTADGPKTLIRVANEQEKPFNQEAPKIIRTSSPKILSWSVAPDPVARERIIQELSSLADKHGVPVSPAQIEAAMPSADNGWIDASETGLELVSNRGMLPLLLPLLYETKERWRDAWRISEEELTAKRLRFLLGVASQFQFWQMAVLDARSPNLPKSLATLPLDDMRMRRWLDGLAGSFPGDYRTVSAALDEIAAEKPIDDVRYACVSDEGRWRLVAERDGAPMLRIDDRGIMEKNMDGEWVEYRDSLFK